jgi:hypothetical protein
MPSQHDYLVDEELREGLRRREPPAECKLVQRFNRGRRPESRLCVPPASSDYARYDSRLLALLWALAENATALHALARQYGWTCPDSPAYADMPDELLAFLCLASAFAALSRERIGTLIRGLLAAREVFQTAGVPCTQLAALLEAAP